MELRKMDDAEDYGHQESNQEANSIIEVVQMQKVKAQEEIERAAKEAEEEKEAQMAWEKQERERLQREEDLLKQESARRRQDQEA